MTAVGARSWQRSPCSAWRILRILEPRAVGRQLVAVELTIVEAFAVELMIAGIRMSGAACLAGRHVLWRLSGPTSFFAGCPAVTCPSSSWTLSWSRPWMPWSSSSEVQPARVALTPVLLPK